MKEDIISHIQDNREVSRIYSELRAGFFAYNHITFPMIREEDREEIYNDSFIALCNNISSGKLQQLTCSLQTYINQIGKNKTIDLLRKKNSVQSLPEYEIIGCGNNLDITYDDNNAIAIERQEEIYKLVKEMENDTCRKILFGFYWQRHSMEALAELIGLNNADVAKSTKVRCFTKLRNAVLAAFRKKGLI